MINKSLVKKDLYSNLVSPHFYICLLVLFLSTCIQFFFIQRFFVTGFGSTNLNTFFLTVPYVYSLIIPILVLQSSNVDCENTFPFSSIKIICSKILSNFILIILMFIPLFIVPVFVNIFGSVDFGQVFCGFTGIILYGILAISICLLLNELIESRPLFISISIIILLIIDLLHQIPLYLNTNDFFTNIFNNLSFVYHFDSFSKGIIDTRDFLFFLLLSLTFIILSYYFAEKKKGKLFFTGKLGLYSILVILILIFAFIDNSKIYKKFDFTKDKQFSVSNYTKNTLSSVSEPVRISYYRSKSLLSLYPSVRDVYDYLKICANENKNISLNLINADKKEHQDVLSQLGVMPQQIQSVNNNKTEYIKVYSAVVIEYLGKKDVIPFILSTASLQFELNIRFDKLIKNKNRSVYLLSGNEYSPNEYNYIQLLLNASGINCYPLAKDSLPYIYNQLENDIPLLIFGTSSFTPEESSIIENFILNGGKALIATSQYSVNINGDWGLSKNIDDNFIPVLEKWGVNFENKLVNDISNVRISFISTDKNPDALNDNPEYAYVNYPQWISILPQVNAPNGMTMYWCSPIKENSNIVPLLFSSDASWTVKEFDKSVQNQTNELFVTSPFYVQKTFIDDPLFKKEKSIIGCKITKPITGLYNFITNETPKVIVIPSQYLALDVLLEIAGGQTSDFRNTDFILSTILDLTDDLDLKNMQYGGIRNSSLYKVTDVLHFAQLKKLVIIWNFIIIPTLIIFIGIFIFIVRKKKNEKYKI